ncbi:MAG TPA: radical SAM protein, partial [Verrucomicrobiae bacterium]|nr:radical SAM protein [Verrucomicrobiae bacterium]
MKMTSLCRKLKRGVPYLGKELRAIASDRSPFFIAVPRVVHIWREAPCNGRCIMCTYGYLKGDAYKALCHSEFTDEMMPRALSEIHDLCGRGTLVSYMGGEPTICRDIVRWIEQAGWLGLDFRFTTNGYRMDEDMASRFVAAGLFNLGVSLESLDPAVNEIIRPYPGGTARTLRCIELILKERERQKKHLSLNIKTVITAVNLDSFIAIAKRFGKLDGVICTPQMFEPLPDMPLETKRLLMIKDLDRLQRVTDQIRALKRDGYAIHVTEQGLTEMVRLYREARDDNFVMGEETLEMDPSEPACNIATDNLWIHNGGVKLCPNFPPIGNMVTDPQTSLKQIWRSEMARRVRANTRSCRKLCT